MSTTTSPAPTTFVPHAIWPEENDKPFMLFQSKLDDDSTAGKVLFEVLQNQPHFEEFTSTTADTVKLSLNYVDATRRPVGTIFVSNDYTLRPDGSVHIETFKPLLFEQAALPIMGGITPEVTQMLDYLVYYFHQNPDLGYGEELARKVESEYAVYGYQVNWEELLFVPEPEPEEEPVREQTIVEMLLERYPCPPEDKYNFYVDPRIWKELIYDRYHRINTLLTGPTGSGKTELVDIVLREFGEELHIQDMSTVQDANSSLQGVHRINHAKESVFDPAPFVHYIRSGHGVLLDEINRAPQSANNLIFPCLDRRRYLPLDIAGEHEERRVPVHEQTWFVGTANLGSQYGGTNEIDMAFKNRFHVLELDYMRPEDEKRMLVLRTGVDELSADTIVKLAVFSREQVKDQGLTEAISTRHTLGTAERVAGGFTLLEAIESVIYPLYEDDGVDSQREAIRTAVASF